jgi:curli biogenesis system outer membrane secretion channel CsgG
MVNWLGVLAIVVAAVALPDVSSAQQPANAVPGAVAAPTSTGLKLKIAIGRFSNETRYGRSLLSDANLDPIGKQAADILSAYLAQTGRFLVLERPDLTKVEGEQKREAGGNTISADTLIIGSVVELGRTEDGKRGLFNSGRVQRAHAKVAVRLVDVRTGVVFHSATGEGEATTETKTVLGVGSTSAFDGTLTDKAISVAVEDMLEELVNTLAARPWRTDILAVECSQIFIAGGEKQGLTVGARLGVVRAGRKVRSAQSGFEIELPAAPVAELEIVSLFGDNDTNQGAATRIVSGSIDGIALSELVVRAK